MGLGQVAVEDECGRNPALRDKVTSIVVFPEDYNIEARSSTARPSIFVSYLIRRANQSLT